MATLSGKKLVQLRVVDLRAELEKRGLDKAGLKGTLVERLEKSLLDESGELTDLDSTIADELDESQNGDREAGIGTIPDDFSGFIVLDSGEDSDHDDDDEPEAQVISKKKDARVVDKMDVTEKKETEKNEVKDTSKVEQIDLCVEDQEVDDDEGSLEFEYQAAESIEETIEEDKEEDETDEVVANEKETKKVEIATPAPLAKPNENQLSLSLCVNTDDVQDDLDEDLKEIENKKDVVEESVKEDEENVDEVSPDMETDENTAEGAQTEEKNVMAVDEEAVDEEAVDEEAVDEEAVDEEAVDEEAVDEEAVDEEAGDEPKDEEGVESEKAGVKETVVEIKETKKVVIDLVEPKEKEGVEEAKKDAKKEEKKEDKKDVKEKVVKKEEPAKKVVKKDEKKPEKKVEKKPEKKAEGKDDKKADAKKKEVAGKSLWVSNLSSMTRAADLKTRFTQYGKVVGAKIVTNSKAPGAQCFGLVTMSTSEESAKCIQHLHRTEMHGRNITVDRAKGDRIPTVTPSAKKAAEKKGAKAAAVAKAKNDKAKEKEKSTEKKPSDKEKADKPAEKPPASKATTKTAAAKTGKESDAKGEKGKAESAGKTSNRSTSTDKKDVKDAKKSTTSSRPKGDDAKPAKNLKSLDDVRREKRERQIRERRERERRDRVRRERERIAREKAMERERERLRQRERERRRIQILREKEERERQERLRLERERQRLRELERQRERERQERERERLLQERRQREDRERLQRERERLERERLQRLERERVERQRMEERRGVKRPADAYVRDRSPTRGPGYWQDTKRPAPDRGADSRVFFGGMSGGRERGAREAVEPRPGPPRERRNEPRVSSHSAPKRDEPPRDDHRRVDRERANASRSSREPPRDSRDRRASWEAPGAMQNTSDPQKGLSLLLQRAGVSGILGDFSGRSSGGSLAKPVAPSAVSSSLSRERPAVNWNGRTASAHSRPLMSSMTQAPANPAARVGRPPAVSDSGRSWPPSADKDRERVRDRGVATREMSRSSWSGSANPSTLMAASAHSVGHDRSRQVAAASRTAVPPRMVTQHSVSQPMNVTASSMMDGRRAVAMSGRSEPFRSGVAGLPRSGTMRRY